MAFFRNFVSNLGAQNAPFGFGGYPADGGADPAFNSGLQMIGNVGLGMLAQSNSNPLEAFGRSYLNAQQNSQEQNRQQFMAQQMMQDAEYKKQDRQRQQEERDKKNAWLKSISDPKQRAMLEAYPELVDNYIQATDPVFQKADANGGNSNWGMSPIPVYNSKTKQYAVGQFNQGQGGVFVDGQPIAGTDWQPYDPYSLNQQKAAGTATGKEMGGAAASLPGAQIDVQAMNDKIDMIRDNPSLGNAIGYGNALGDYFVGNDVLAIRSQLNELEGGAFLSAYSTLKGGGQITEMESSQAKQAIADMQTARKMSDVDKFKEALERFRAAVNRGYLKLQRQAGQYAPDSPAQDPLAQAREAIRAGADPEAVKKRLLDNGINPAGL